MWHSAVQGIGALIVLQALQLPAPQGFVNDFAGVIPAASRQRIERLAEDVRAKSGGDIAVVTLRDIGDRDVADVGLQILREWKLGKAGQPGDPTRNNGVVILVVPKETSSDGRGHFRIETGFGAEGFLPDAVTGAIQDEALPLLRQQDYGGAMELAAQRVAERFAREYNFTLDSSLAAPAPEPVPVPRPVGGGGIPPQLILILFIFLLFFLNSLGSRRRGCGGCLPIFLPFPGGYGRGGWGGGSWGGGGWGGGGGGFGGGFGGFGGGGGGGGGGSSRSW